MVLAVSVDWSFDLLSKSQEVSMLQWWTIPSWIQNISSISWHMILHILDSLIMFNYGNMEFLLMVRKLDYTLKLILPRFLGESMELQLFVNQLENS